MTVDRKYMESPPRNCDFTNGVLTFQGGNCIWRAPCHVSVAYYVRWNGEYGRANHLVVWRRDGDRIHIKYEFVGREADAFIDGIGLVSIPEAFSGMGQALDMAQAGSEAISQKRESFRR